MRCRSSLPGLVPSSCLLGLTLRRWTRNSSLSGRQRQFLREIGLRTWRYFATFSNEANHWLIPDNVQEKPYRVAERISPTNLGLLLNSRQAALGVRISSTFPSSLTLTERTFTTILRLPRHFGHFVNWYETTTLQPIEPRFISSVDNGNFVASLWSLKEGLP